MCGLLQICLAPELRYLGSCLEDMCRRDVFALKTLSSDANSITEIEKLTDNLMDDGVRARWNCLLSLMESTNSICANAMYKILRNCIDRLFVDVMHLQKDETLHNGLPYKDVIEDLLLLFTMASNHPAFSFCHRFEFDSCLIHLQSLIKDEDLSEKVCLCFH